MFDFRAESHLLGSPNAMKGKGSLVKNRTVSISSGKVKEGRRKRLSCTFLMLCPISSKPFTINCGQKAMGCLPFIFFLHSEMTMALIDAAHDRDEETKSVIGNALFELGKKKPHLVLSTCHFYLKKHNKVRHFV